MVDLKKPETWFPNLKKIKGQVSSQYTIGTYRTGRDLPAMMTDLNGNNHIFHQETNGGELLTKEVVFQNQAQAFKYLGRLIEEASKALAQPIDCESGKLVFKDCFLCMFAVCFAKSLLTACIESLFST